MRYLGNKKLPLSTLFSIYCTAKVNLIVTLYTKGKWETILYRVILTFIFFLIYHFEYLWYSDTFRSIDFVQGLQTPTVVWRRVTYRVAHTKTEKASSQIRLLLDLVNLLQSTKKASLTQSTRSLESGALLQSTQKASLTQSTRSLEFETLRGHTTFLLMTFNYSCNQMTGSL